MPHKYWQANYGKGLRRLLADGKHLRGVIDFGDQQVFRGATTYTAIQVFGKEPLANGVDYSKVVDLEDGRAAMFHVGRRKLAPGTERFVTHKSVAMGHGSF